VLGTDRLNIESEEPLLDKITKLQTPCQKGVVAETKNRQNAIGRAEVAESG
jgi:hypothetical protein